MNLEKILLNSGALKKFLDERFHNVNFSKFEKTRVCHLLVLLNFNKALTSNDEKLHFCSLLVKDIYMLDRGSDLFCTYLLVDITKEKFDLFEKEFGYPEDLLEGEFKARNFEHLVWSINGFDVFVNRLHHKLSTNDSYIIR